MVRRVALVSTLALLVAGPVSAGPKCTGNGERLPEAQVQEMYKRQGYEIQRWKISSGGCYEIYGRLNGQKVETYIDPWTGAKLEEHRS